VQVVRGRGYSSGMEQRTNIKFCFKLGKTAVETLEMMRQVYGDNCLSRAQIFRWHARFKSGVEMIEDEARPGRPFSVCNEALIAKVRERIQEEHCATVRMVADEFVVNREMIRQILVEDLGKRKVASRFVPHSLSDDQRHKHVQYAKDIIKTSRRNKNFLNSIVAEDETRCFHYDPTTKCQSAEWKSPVSPKGKKVCLQKSKVKTMLVCFCDSKGIIHHECVPEEKTVTGSFYLSVLECLWKRIRHVWPEYSAPGSWFLLHDNAPVHQVVAIQEFLARKQVCMLSHPPYSPDLSPCDYFLFPKLKLPLKGCLFEDVQDIQGAVTSSLRAIPQEDVQRSFHSLLDRATRCIDAEGMYFE